ncbi:PREDICTED: uncharacterized protein LOC109235987 [Nicotiana attenuata]|uniref:uncharacterized protein LOC109235987 n=1 Tax=Nicotiana attenuata TaxID=49451 RepID=UPI0009046CC0|nr:PREDICTED: uncharacterized protein LOC109235987 [Nicotiana attenuata]
MADVEEGGVGSAGYGVRVCDGFGLKGRWSISHRTKFTCSHVLLKKFGEYLSKEAMIWYHNLLANSIDSFAMLADSFVKAHAGAIKVENRKSTSSNLVASQQLKQNLKEHPAITWADVHNQCQSKIRVEDDQLGAPSGSVYPVRPIDRVKRDIDREPMSNRDLYQPYNEDRRSSGYGRGSMQNERRSDRGKSSRGLMSKNGFDKPIGPKEAPRRIKDTKWPRPIQFDLAQRDPNQICKYHGTHGHRTEDCRQLREEVARLFNNWHLREFLSD